MVIILSTNISNTLTSNIYITVSSKRVMIKCIPSIKKKKFLQLYVMMIDVDIYVHFLNIGKVNLKYLFVPKV